MYFEPPILIYRLVAKYSLYDHIFFLKIKVFPTDFIQPWSFKTIIVMQIHLGNKCTFMIRIWCHVHPFTENWWKKTVSYPRKLLGHAKPSSHKQSGQSREVLELSFDSPPRWQSRVSCLTSPSPGKGSPLTPRNSHAHAHSALSKCPYSMMVPRSDPRHFCLITRMK